MNATVKKGVMSVGLILLTLAAVKIARSNSTTGPTVNKIL